MSDQNNKRFSLQDISSAMKVVLLLLCLVLIQIFSARAEDQNTELSRDASVGMGRQVREAGQKVKNKSSKKEKIGKKNAKVSRKINKNQGEIKIQRTIMGGGGNRNQRERKSQRKLMGEKKIKTKGKEKVKER